MVDGLVACQPARPCSFESACTEKRSTERKAEPAVRRPELIGRGAAVKYTDAYCEPDTVDSHEVVAVQNAKGPE